MKNARCYASVVILAVVTTAFVILIGPAGFSFVSAQSSQTEAGEVTPKAYLPVIFGTCRQGGLIFSDAFSDPGSGWTTLEYDEFKVGYHNGEYRILIRVEDYLTGPLREFSSVDSGYRVAADVRNVNERPGHYGLGFGFKGGVIFDFYSYEVNRTGNYYVYYHTRNTPDPVVTTLLDSGLSADIRTGTASNNLAVVHYPSALYFYANGQLLTTLPSDRTGAERMGMIAKTTTASDLDIRIDNFEMHEFDCEPSS